MLAVTSFVLLDWIALGSYLAVVVAIGVWAGRGQGRADDFFLGGRRMPLWAVAISVLATAQSAATFVGGPQEAYDGNLTYLAANLVALVVTYAYHHRSLGYRIHPENRRLLAWSIPGVVVGVLLTLQDDLLVGRLLPLAMATVWLWANRSILERLRARDL